MHTPGALDVPRPKRDSSADYSQPSREGKVSISVWVTPEERDTLKIVAIEQKTSVQDILKAAVDRALAKKR